MAGPRITLLQSGPETLKHYLYWQVNLAQAQLELHHPNEALSSAITAYEICSRSPKQTSSAFAIAGHVLKCKRAKWDIRERDRLRRRSELLALLEAKLEQDRNTELADIDERLRTGDLGEIGAQEEKESILANYNSKIGDLRSTFAIADPANMALREVPDYLIDAISFEIMHDPVVTKAGHSYERATIIEALKRNPTGTIDPLDL